MFVYFKQTEQPPFLSHSAEFLISQPYDLKSENAFIPFLYQILKTFFLIENLQQT